MENSKIFQIIKRINSILFLIFAAGGCLAVIFIIFSTNRWQDRRAVEVVQNNAAGEKDKIELVLGNIADIPGYDTQFVRLRSRASGGKFSSYSGGGETRNVLFVTGNELNTHWLYKSHSYLIDEFSILKQQIEKNKEKAVAIYIETIKDDSNNNNHLDRDDLHTIALTDPYGNKYTEIDSQVQSVIDRNVVENGEYLLVLMQNENKIILKKYSLKTFELASEKVIDEILKKR